jgi:para-aminobenzoate synthetase component 2
VQSPQAVEPDEGVAARVVAERGAFEQAKGATVGEALINRYRGVTVELEHLGQCDRVISLERQGSKFVKSKRHVVRLVRPTTYNVAMSRGPHLLVVDNYDSFVYNLVQYVGELGATVNVVRNDKVDACELAQGDYDGVLVSPGPGHPRSAGNCLDIIRHCAEANVPMLGICLGHQALGEAFGADIVLAPELLHGRSSVVQHNSTGVFAGLPAPMIAGRYHSLVVEPTTLPECFEVTATSGGLIMGMRHISAPLEGVQFHPESVLTQHGYRLLANWLTTCGSTEAAQRAEELVAVSELIRQSLPEPVAVH